MEETNTTIPTKETGERVRYDDTHVPGCPFWIFGDKDSADKDLKGKFEILEDAKKD